jgi:hypothetical protein
MPAGAKNLPGPVQPVCPAGAMVFFTRIPGSVHPAFRQDIARTGVYKWKYLPWNHTLHKKRKDCTSSGEGCSSGRSTSVNAATATGQVTTALNRKYTLR